MTEKLLNSNYQTVQVGDRTLLVSAVVDLDGTSNNELEPERTRLQTVLPAKQAFSYLESIGIPVSIATARAVLEADVYAKEMDTHGGIIGEDGAALLLPEGANIDYFQEQFTAISVGNRVAIALSSVTIKELGQFIRNCENLLGEELLPSCFTNPEVLSPFAGHFDPEFTRLSIARVACAYIANLSDRQAELILQQITHWDLDHVWGSRDTPIVVKGKDANKGTALQILNDYPEVLTLGNRQIDGILPIVFGNSKNDLVMFEKAHQLGGIAVVVAHPDGGYFIPEEAIPNYVIKATRPYGEGIREVIPQVISILQDRFQIDVD